ncbi:MAG: hypothetical protein GX221_11505 [Candidatus Riflebacteria bacterium]|nr:hypothetical protein [Candidatus Riflebacteria bacterium]
MILQNVEITAEMLTLVIFSATAAFLFSRTLVDLVNEWNLDKAIEKSNKGGKRLI